MIRKIFETQEDELHIKLPQEFIGKQIEVLIFDTQEAKQLQQIDTLKQTDIQIKQDEITEEELDIKIKQEDTATTPLEQTPQIQHEEPEIKIKLEDDPNKEDLSTSLKEKEEEQQITPQIHTDQKDEIDEKQEPQQNNIKPTFQNNTSKQHQEPRVFEGKILIAEDNEINQKLICRLLQDLGFQVETASNGLVALQRRQNEDFDLIFMDIAMPIMDGIEATKGIKKFEEENKKAHIPIVACTANSSHEDREKYLQEGVDGYIAKPLKKAKVIEVLDMFLNKDNTTKPTQNKESATEEVKDKINLNNIQDISKISEEQNITIKKDENQAQTNYDVIICRKNPIETNISKSIVTQLGASCNTCQNFDELKQKFDEFYHKVAIIDVEVSGFDINNILEWRDISVKKHDQGETAIVILAQTNSNISGINRNNINKLIKGIFGRFELEKLINEYCKEQD